MNIEDEEIDFRIITVSRKELKFIPLFVQKSVWASHLCTNIQSRSRVRELENLRLLTLWLALILLINEIVIGYCFLVESIFDLSRFEFENNS